MHIGRRLSLQSTSVSPVCLFSMPVPSLARYRNPSWHSGAGVFCCAVILHGPQSFGLGGWTFFRSIFVEKRLRYRRSLLLLGLEDSLGSYMTCVAVRLTCPGAPISETFSLNPWDKPSAWEWHPLTLSRSLVGASSGVSLWTVICLSARHQAISRTAPNRGPNASARRDVRSRRSSGWTPPSMVACCRSKPRPRNMLRLCFQRCSVT
ncbi:hypothetical protein D9M68_579710 [compost metagenome]